MKQLYKTIGLIGKPNHQGASATIKVLHDYLHSNNYKVLIEQTVAQSLTFDCINILHRRADCEKLYFIYLSESRRTFTVLGPKKYPLRDF